MSNIVRVPLLGAVVLLLVAALAVALVPAGIDLDRRVTEEMRRVAIEDLGRAPMILEDRTVTQVEALSMHAHTVAETKGLAAALRLDRRDEAERLARGTASMYGEDPVLVSATGAPIVGPQPTPEGLAALRSGVSWTGYVFHAGMPRVVGLAAVGDGDAWLGAAGSTTPFDSEVANTLAGLSRSAVTVFGPEGELVASTLDSAFAVELGRVAGRDDGLRVSEKVVELSVSGAPHWVSTSEIPAAGLVLFSRDIASELAALPGVRRSYALAGLVALVLALTVSAGMAVVLLRPVQGLATAADRLRAGDFSAPVPDSRVGEVARLAAAFRQMRGALRSRIDELADANRALEERQERLTALQAELIRQDRLASSARMAAELAHEIRNPVANVRNCLEVVRRGLPDDSEGSRFADMAIDELLRMHELTEHLLDLHRPEGVADGVCDVAAVAKRVAALAAVGDPRVAVHVDVGSGAPRAAISSDALTQVLINLVINAGEAGGPETRVDVSVGGDERVVRIVVVDDGPGIPAKDLPHLFDAFFTSKGAVTGVGLGLFVAEGLVRRQGGRIEAGNGERGARFTIEIPVATEAVA